MLLGLLAAAAYGGSDFFGGLASRRSGSKAVVFTSQVFSIALVALLALFFHSGTVRGQDALLAIGAGAAGILAVGALYPALAIGPMSVVAPITAVISGAVPVAYALVVGERVTWIAGLGVVGALCAAALISRPQDEHEQREHRLLAIALAIVAGLVFGAATAMLSRISLDAGLMPFYLMRVAGVAVLLVGVMLVPGPFVPGRGDRWMAVVVGGAELLGTMTAYYATRNTELVIFAPVSALGPAVTVVAARAVLHEPIGRMQYAGLGLALVALMLISTG